LPAFRLKRVIDFASAAAAIDVAGNRGIQEFKHMKQFVAMTDEMLYRPDGPPGPLVPYQIGVFCWHQLREEVRAGLAACATEARDALRESRDALSA